MKLWGLKEEEPSLEGRKMTRWSCGFGWNPMAVVARNYGCSKAVFVEGRRDDDQVVEVVGIG